MTKFPEGAVSEVVKFLRGKGDKLRAVNAAYHLLGFAIENNIKGTGLVPDDETVASELEKLSSRVSSEILKSEMPEAPSKETRREFRTVVTPLPIKFPPWSISFLTSFINRNLST